MDPRYQPPTANIDRDDSEFRDLDVLTTTVRWLLIAGIALGLLNLVTSEMQLEMLSRSFTREEAAANAQLVAAAVGLISLCTLATIVFFGRWIYLAHRNLPELGATRLEMPPGWAVGWFFVPIANLWKPYQAMRSLWRSSHDVVRPELQDSTWVLPTWWTVWLISTILGNVETQMAMVANTPSELSRATEASMIHFGIDLVRNIVAIVLVTRIWRAQQAQHENPGEFAPAPGFADAPAAPAAGMTESV